MTNKIKLVNMTSHDQKNYLQQFEEAGFEIVTKPLGFNVPTDMTFQGVKEKVAEQLVSAEKDGCNFDDAELGFLLGGLTSSTIAAYQVAEVNGWDCYEVVTEREQDEQGKFVFNFKGVRKLG